MSVFFCSFLFPVSQHESQSWFDIVTQLADIGKRPSSYLQFWFKQTKPQESANFTDTGKGFAETVSTVLALLIMLLLDPKRDSKNVSYHHFVRAYSGG